MCEQGLMSIYPEKNFGKTGYAEIRSKRVQYNIVGDTYGVYRLSDTENENNNYGFHYNMQNSSHCTETDNNIDFH